MKTKYYMHSLIGRIAGSKKLIRRYEASENSDFGECIVELHAIDWELYALSINGYEEKRVIGLDNAMNLLEDYNCLDNPEFKRTF